jgi:hypothetical protein
MRMVTKSESPKLVTNDALKGGTQEGPGHWLLQDTANEKVNLGPML